MRKNQSKSKFQGGSNTETRADLGHAATTAWRHDQRSDHKIDDAITFNASSRTIRPLEWHSNCTWGSVVRGLKIRKLRDVVGDSSTTSGRTGKWTAAFDSPHRISLKTPGNKVLVVVGGPAVVHQKSRKSAKSETFSHVTQQPAIVRGNGLQDLIRCTK